MTRALITGGASGLGAAAADRLRRDGIEVITVDRADFSIYRRNKREAIPLVCPPGVS